MAIITRAQLRKWFGKGKYPTAEQFSSFFDSFWHKTEDKIAINSIEGLAEQLNSKLSEADGEKLKQEVATVAADLKRQDEAIDQLREQLDSLLSVVENDCVQRTTRVILRGGSPADLVNENNK